MTAFVTGGSGFIGGAIIRRLLAEGREVRALARSDAAAEVVAATGARPVLGDLLARERLAEAIRGCDVVFHAAGISRLCPRSTSDLDATNVDGAEAVVHAAAEAGASRVVHTSSAATIGERAGAVGREDSAHRGSFLSPYERSKYLAERRVLEAGRAAGIDVICVNPSSVQGPGRTEGTARILIRLAGARTAALIATWISLVDIDDCAEGHIRAERLGLPGERYVLSGATISTRSAVALLREQTGRPTRVVWLPRWAVRAAMPLTAVAPRTARSEDPPICPASIRTLLHGHRYDGSRATRDLGLVYRPIEETLARTLAWYEERGILRPSARA